MSVQDQGFDLMILVGPFQFGLVCDSLKCRGCCQSARAGRVSHQLQGPGCSSAWHQDADAALWCWLSVPKCWVFSYSCVCCWAGAQNPGVLPFSRQKLWLGLKAESRCCSAMPGGLYPPLCCQQTSGDSRLAGRAREFVCCKGSSQLLSPTCSRPPAPPWWAARLHCTGGQAWKSPGLVTAPGRSGKVLCALWTVSTRADSLEVCSVPPCLVPALPQGIPGWNASPCLPQGCASLHRAQAPLEAKKATGALLLAEREGGEQLNRSPERNFQKNQPASGTWPCKKCFPSPWLLERGLHVVETSLIPGGCKTGTKRVDWGSLWLRVWGWKPAGCQSCLS